MSNKIYAFAPGRTELAGNHVDHQHGVAVTGSLTQGIQANVCLNNTNIINIKSEGFEPFEVNINDIKNKEYLDNIDKFTSKSLVEGIVYSFIKRNIQISGFDAIIKSDIPSGMGLSSSAAFELLIGVILNMAFNNNKLSKMELAQIGHFAEVEFYGKNCGLLDQTAISYGGIIKIDFSDPDNLNVLPINFSFKDKGISAILVNCGAEHGNISDMYSSIPDQMIKVANNCNVNYLNETNTKTLFKNLNNIKQKTGQKPCCRAIHYFHEINLVKQRIKALENNDMRTFMYLHGLSGSSSAQFLQNVNIDNTQQDATLCQAICELALDITCNNDYTNRGASRIHGGGFGGCIQIFLPHNQTREFCNIVDNVYNKTVAFNIDFSKLGAYAKFEN